MVGKGYNQQFKPFIANRIGEIQISTNHNKWRQLPTAENPVNHLTRGTTYIVRVITIEGLVARTKLYI